MGIKKRISSILIGTVVTALVFTAILLAGSRLKASGAAEDVWENLKPLLFADQPESLLIEDDIPQLTQPNQTYAADDWQHLLATAVIRSRQGNPEAARKALKECLAIPELEPRVRLAVWGGLRRLGERPELNAGREAQGIVIEVPADKGVDILAAYSNGTARYLNYSGAAIIWEAGDHQRVNPLVMNLLKTTQALVNGASVIDKRPSQLPRPGFVRISVLTYGGIHVTETKMTDLERSSDARSAVFLAGTQLLVALVEENGKMKQVQE